MFGNKPENPYVISYNDMILLKIMNYCILIKQRLVQTQNTIC